MKRRTLLGLAAGTITGSFAIGSGAFDSVEAERTVAVEVADDDEALLVIDAEAVGIGGRSSLVRSGHDEPRQATFRIPGPDEDGIAGTDPDGIGKRSSYEFDKVAIIRNQGAQTVDVYSDHQGDLDKIAIYDVDSPEILLTGPENAVTLPAGGEFTIGLHLETSNQEPNEFDETVTIVAEDS